MNSKIFVLLFLFQGTFLANAQENSLIFDDPKAVYINWAAYDELSDTVKLTEALAIKQLDECIRLKKSGVRIDYYIMDCFWFDQYGGYIGWRKEGWPNGPDQWLKKCLDNNIKPGLWLSVNAAWGLNPKPIPEWERSYNNGGYSLTEGNYLSGLIKAMQYWYDRGIRMFKFDFANFSITAQGSEKVLLAEDRRRLNEEAFKNALKKFYQKNPEVVFLAYNGFGGTFDNTTEPFYKDVDLKWLEAFHSLYSGDPRLADVPTFNFYRSKDIFTDYTVRRYQFNQVPLERIDGSSFMIGNTGTCYNRKKEAWKGTLILSHARGGWMNTYYGDLSLLDENDVKWFAKVQSLYLTFQSLGRIKAFGSNPAERKSYGFVGLTDAGSVYTLVNPSQKFDTVQMPIMSHQQAPIANGNILFHDAGFVPVLNGNSIIIGPEQLVVVGFGEYAGGKYELGIQEDVIIPVKIEPLNAKFEAKGSKTIEAQVQPPTNGDLRIIMQQFSSDGKAVRTTGGAPPKGVPLDEILIISVEQKGKKIPIILHHDKAIWSGLSWAAVEVKKGSFKPGIPITIKCSTTEKKDVELKGEVYNVWYEKK